MMDTPPKRSELNSSIIRGDETSHIPVSGHKEPPGHVFLSNSKSKSYTLQKTVGSERFIVNDTRDHNNQGSEGSRK
jgi:hypothetical protein